MLDANIHANFKSNTHFVNHHPFLQKFQTLAQSNPRLAYAAPPTRHWTSQTIHQLKEFAKI